MMLKRAKEKKLRHVDDLIKMLFRDESRIWIDQSDDAGTFVRCLTNEIPKDNYLKEKQLISQYIEDMEMPII